MNRTLRIMKYICMPVLSIYMIYEMWISLGMTADTIQKMGFDANTAFVIVVQGLTICGIALLAAIILQNLFSLYVVLCYKDKTQVSAGMWKLILWVDKASIILSMLMRLSIALVFIGISCIAFFAPNVNRDGSSVYVLGIFFLVLAGFTATSTIRYAKYRLKYELQEVNDDRE